VRRDEFERFKIKKFRSNSCWTPADTTLKGQDGLTKGQSRWVMAGWAGLLFFLKFKKKVKKSSMQRRPEAVPCSVVMHSFIMAIRLYILFFP
jgi:hypothetical protein